MPDLFSQNTKVWLRVDVKREGSQKSSETRVALQQNHREISQNFGELTKSPPPSPSDHQQSLRPRVKLTDMPAEIIDKIASHLQGKDTKALRCVNRFVGEVAQSHVNQADAIQSASQQPTPEEFKTILSVIKALHRFEHHAEPLFQLGRWIHTLPELDKLQLKADFQAAVLALPEAYKPSKLSSLARVMDHANPTAAIEAFENVQIVAHAWNITTEQGIRDLEDKAIDSLHPNSVGTLARSGGNVKELAEERGITTAQGIRNLEDTAIESRHPNSVGTLARNGGNVKELANERGITTAQGIRDLEDKAINSLHRNSVGTLARSGGNVKELANKRGITTAQGIRDLEDTAIKSRHPNSVGILALNGGNVKELAEKRGITTDEGIRDLATRSKPLRKAAAR